MPAELAGDPGSGQEFFAGWFAVIVVPAEPVFALGAGQAPEAAVGGLFHDELGAEDIIDFGGTERGIKRVAGCVLVFSAGFRDMMGEESGATVLDEDRMDLLTEERVYDSLGGGITADVGEKGVSADEVGRFSFETGPEHALDEFRALLAAGRVNDNVHQEAIGLCLGQTQAGNDAIAHFGNVTFVVFGLDENDLHALRWFHAECSQTICPVGKQRHQQGGLAGAGRGGQQHEAVSAKPAVFDQFVGITGRWGLKQAQGFQWSGQAQPEMVTNTVQPFETGQIIEIGRTRSDVGEDRTANGKVGVL